ncbi:MAG: cation-translocating P-type ATPase [Caldisericia bacterium]
MMCSGCSGSVARVLENLPSVKNVSVSYISGTAKLSYDPKKVSIDEITKAIENVGYKPKKLRSGENILNAAKELKIRDFNQTGKNLLMGIIPSVLVIFLSMYQMFVVPFPDWVNWVLFVLAVFVVSVPGGHFFVETVKQAINRQTNMSTLVSVGVTASIVFSLVSLLNPNVTGGILYIEGAVMIVMLVSLGHYIRLRSELSAMKDVFDVASLLPDVAHIAIGDLVNDINPAELKPGNEVIVRATERIPADGIIISGETEINNASITGESVPVLTKPGDKVYAGAVTGYGTIRVRCEKTGAETVVSRVVEMVASALSSKPKIQEMVDKIASIFVPIVFTITILVFDIWWLLGNPNIAVLTSISVLVISCPCALGLATPTALSVALGITSRKGILIKDAVAFETLLSIKNFVFDKTGTLTIGKPEVNSVQVLTGTNKEMVQLAVSAESGSEHSLAEAVRESMQKEKQITEVPVEDFEALPGLGVKATIDGKTIHVGGPRLLQKLGLDIPLLLAGGFGENEAVFM